MKVLDLQCAQGHSFEGWFGSHDEYDTQCASGLLSCPICNDHKVTKRLSAPRLHLGHGRGDRAEAAAEPSSGTPVSDKDLRQTDPVVQMQAAMLQAMRHVLAHTEDVGPRFAEEARKIHYGEREERNIRGQATRAETEALLDEGIEVLPLPEAFKEPLQ